MPEASAPAAATRIALLGHRNVGKSTLFNALTGSTQKVANYPGVTVERREGVLVGDTGEDLIEVLDLPGTNSLVARAPDEEVVAAALLGEMEGLARPAAICLVIDATQLQRGLFLLSQVADLGIPMIVALNMSDDARREGIELDAEALSGALDGIPVVATSAATGAGVETLRALLASAAELARPVRPVSFGHIGNLPEAGSQRWQSLRQAAESDELGAAELSARWSWVDLLVKGLKLGRTIAERERSDRIDGVVLHKLFGPLGFLLVMGTLFQAVFYLADPAIGVIENAMGWLSSTVAGLLPEGLLQTFLVDGAIAGVGAVVVFLPQILILFFLMGLLEDTGYLARAAFIADAPLRKVGLSGRSFVPLLSSFACAIPGIMATRTIEDRRERFLAILVAPLLTCAARLPVYALLIAAFVPKSTVLGFVGVQGLVLLALYLIGMLFAAGAAWVIDRFQSGARTPLIMELPPYRAPSFGTILRRLWDRASAFLTRAGTIILAMSVLVWAALTFPGGPLPEDASPGERAAQIEGSVAGTIGHAIEPVIAPLGFDWRIGIGLVGSLAAREVFIATMGVTYAVENEEDEPSVEAAMKASVHDDTLLPVYDLPTVLALLAFFALALQCVSTVAIVKRETRSTKLAAAQFFTFLALAWAFAWIVRQIALLCI